MQSAVKIRTQYSALLAFWPRRCSARLLFFYGLGGRAGVVARGRHGRQFAAVARSVCSGVASIVLLQPRRCVLHLLSGWHGLTTWRGLHT